MEQTKSKKLTSNPIWAIVSASTDPISSFCCSTENTTESSATLHFGNGKSPLTCEKTWTITNQEHQQKSSETTKETEKGESPWPSRARTRIESLEQDQRAWKQSWKPSTRQDTHRWQTWTPAHGAPWEQCDQIPPFRFSEESEGEKPHEPKVWN